jgi:hypothetical protein
MAGRYTRRLHCRFQIRAVRKLLCFGGVYHIELGSFLCSGVTVEGLSPGGEIPYLMDLMASDKKSRCVLP